MITIWLPLLLAVAGLLVYALTNGKASEAGRILYFCGLLVTLFAMAGHQVRLP